MDTNKMREQFEVQFVEEYVRVLGEGARELAAHTLAANPPLVSMSWWAWQASREAVVVELPEAEFGVSPEIEDDEEYEAAEAIAMCEDAVLSRVRKHIEAQGLKVAP